MAVATKARVLPFTSLLRAMAANPAPPTAGDPLEPVLHEIEAKLKERLRDACEAEANGIENESAGQIRRLEDALLSAAVAAEQTIALRAHIDRRKAEKEHSAGGPPDEGTAASPIRLREFRDSSGQLWRAWPVTPGLARRGHGAEQYLGEFHKG